MCHFFYLPFWVALLGPINSLENPHFRLIQCIQCPLPRAGCLTSQSLYSTPQVVGKIDTWKCGGFPYTIRKKTNTQSDSKHRNFGIHGMFQISMGFRRGRGEHCVFTPIPNLHIAVQTWQATKSRCHEGW